MRFNSVIWILIRSYSAKKRLGQINKFTMKQKIIHITNIVIGCICLLTSCLSNKNESKDLHISSNNISEKANVLVAEEIYLDETFDVSDLAIVKNNIIFQSISSDTIIHVYQLPDFKLLNSFGHIGEGPMELLNPQLYKSTNNRLLIGGFNRGMNAYHYDLDSINVDKHRKYNILNTNEPMNNVYFYNKYLLYNDIFHLNICKYNFDNQSTEVLYSFPKDDHSESFFYSNKGILVANDSTMVYAYFYKDRIDFIDFDGHLQKSILGEKQKPQITINNFISNTTTFVNAFASKFYIFLLYRGKKHEDFMKSPYEDKLLIYDNHGNYVNEYKFDISPILFAFDEDNNILYGYNGLYKECVLFYKINI